MLTSTHTLRKFFLLKYFTRTVYHKGTDKFSSLFKVTMTENQRGVSNETH